MMKKNSLVFSVFGVLALLTLMSFASALDLSASTTPLPQTNGSFTITIANSAGGGTLSYLVKDSTGMVYTGFTFNQSAFTGNETLTVLYTIPTFDFKFGGEYTVTVTATETTIPANNDTVTLTFVQTLFYDGANDGDLDVSTLNFNVLKGFGDDEKYWYPLDEVEIEFTVKNNGNWDVENIEIQTCLFDKADGSCVLDEGDMEIDNDDFNLDSGDKETVTITFQVDAEKLTAGNTHYTFYVKAVGNIDDNDAQDEGFDGDETGDSNSKKIDIITDDNFVILNNLELLGTASCGDTVQVSGEVWNVGDDEEKDVYLKVFNTQLGISQKVEVGDIDSLESKDLLFTVVVPEDAEEGNYDLSFLVYDDNDDIFENTKDDQAQFTLPLSIASGSCSTEVPVSVIASLETTAKAGEEFTVKATVTNTASVRKTFLFEVGGYTDWATFVSVDEPSLTLDAGKSADVLIKLKANEDASGSKNFNIVMKEGSKVLTQPVSVPVAGKGFSITGLFAGLGGNTYLWAIGALNVLLVLIIIVVAVRVVRKK